MTPPDIAKLRAALEGADRLLDHCGCIDDDSEFARAAVRLQLQLALALLPQSAEEESGWREMDSAPKDGTRILAAWGDTVEIIRWHSWKATAVFAEGGMWKPDNIGVAINLKPTHWRPLPAPPASQPAEAEVER